MPTVSEAVGVSQTQLSGAQTAGLQVLSENTELCFSLYNRFVLPVDGYVFWVKAAPVQTLTITPASLHHTTLNQQDENESFSLQKFRLSCQQPVDVLTAIAPNQLWVADWENLKLAFSSRTQFYKTANTYHYSGDALYPVMASQLLEFASQIDVSQVVSNSLPFWLTLAQGFFPLYPSYLVPDNIVPPYGSVHIDETSTRSLQAAPFYDLSGSRWELCREEVKVTTYGVRNDLIMDWLDAVQDYTLNHPDIMGLMNSPVPRDAKRGQTEFSILAQKKTIAFEVNYYQSRLRQLALQYIKTVFVDFIPTGATAQELGPIPAS